MLQPFELDLPEVLFALGLRIAARLHPGAEDISFRGCGPMERIQVPRVIHILPHVICNTGEVRTLVPLLPQHLLQGIAGAACHSTSLPIHRLPGSMKRTLRILSFNTLYGSYKFS